MLRPKKRNYRSQKNQHNKVSFVGLSKEFADSTSMHGLKFVVKKDASKGERILWALLFAGGIFFAAVFSWNLWDKWSRTPVQITIQTINYPIIHSYPFPTVTICSVNKFSTRSLDYWINTPEAAGFSLNETRRILEIIATNNVQDAEEVRNLSELMKRNNISADRYSHLMNTLSPNCTDMLIYCSWEGREERCADLFESESTEGGYCCSFNSIVLTRNATLNEIASQKKLRYTTTSGISAGLTVILDAELEDYNVTSSTFTGFKVSIQDPDDYPRPSQIGFLASPGFEIDASVTGQCQVTDNELKSISVTKRLCATEDEIQLEYFKEYTGPYCELNCKVRFLLKDCGCIPYYYPVPGDLRVCDLSSYACVERVIISVNSNASSCNCPDVCNSIRYSNEISSGIYPNPAAEYPATALNRPEFQSFSTEQMRSYAKENFVKLNVYFKSSSGICYIMDQKTTWTDFISSTGGLLGLGFGFSLLSAAELVYFVTVRWFYYRYFAMQPLNHNEDQTPVYHIPTHYRYLNAIRIRPDPQRQVIKKTNQAIFLQDPPSYNAWIMDDRSRGLSYRPA